ncbi:MAG: hypothetical protein JRC91_01575 [Deltaproteobacteria bacterium]|nr:hypothetical protein [Deltaproteobacteria bacterium]
MPEKELTCREKDDLIAALKAANLELHDFIDKLYMDLAATDKLYTDLVDMVTE